MNGVSQIKDDAITECIKDASDQSSSKVEQVKADPKTLRLAARMRRCQSSPLRDIFKAIDRKGLISFAGGLPAEETFLWANSMGGDIAGKSTNEKPEAILESSLSMDQKASIVEQSQYGASCGEAWLREWICRYLSGIGLSVEMSQVIVVTGSQQGIDLVSKLCIEPGTPVAVEQPTYLAALQSFELFGAELLPYAIDQPITEQNTALCYTNPTFQNPTGRVYSLREREKLAGICGHNNTIIFEDDPYRELYYEDCCRVPICSLMPVDSDWIYQSSFSKTIAPGLRVGFIAASKRLAPYLERLKQAADLHTSRLSQAALRPYLFESYHPRLQRLREFYKDRRDLFNHLLGETFGDIASWEQPKGGMFFWLTLRYEPAISLRDVLEEAIEQGVAYMPGIYFHAGSDNGINFKEDELATDKTVNKALTFRLNFSQSSAESARIGLQKLSRVVRRHITV